MENDKPQQISLMVPYRERISRLFIFRFLWGIPLMFIMMVWMIWMYIVMFLLFWHMLILGKRNAWLWSHIEMFYRYIMRWSYYLYALVDERPKLFGLE